jgi:hypothetical protein
VHNAFNVHNVHSVALQPTPDLLPPAPLFSAMQVRAQAAKLAQREHEEEEERRRKAAAADKLRALEERLAARSAASSALHNGPKAHGLKPEEVGVLRAGWGESLPFILFFRFMSGCMPFPHCALGVARVLQMLGGKGVKGFIPA